MLRIRSRTKTSKQTKVGDHTNHHQWSFPPEKPSKNSSSFLSYFTSRTLFLNNGHLINKFDTMFSPISILDKNTFNVASHIRVLNHNNNAPEIKHEYQRVWEQTYSKQGIGLALIDENSEYKQQQNRKRVVHQHAFGSQLRVKVHNPSLFSSPESPKEFGIKTPRDKIHQQTRVNSEDLDRQNVINYGINGVLMSEIDEESEDYTCVISHGPNPKTTHIFGNCIVESCCGKINDLPSFLPQKSKKFSSFGELIPSKDSFLSFCHHCKKQLGEGHDIYMYRGEKAFCSEQCRCQEVLLDEVEN